MPIEGPARASRRSVLLIFGLLGLGLALIVGTTVALLPGGAARPAMSVIGGPFRLQSSKGGVLDSATLAGKPYLVGFGFTQCPNVCPTVLADLTNLIEALHREGRDIGVYYVTVDPERDTVAVMRDYMASFSDRITGLTGTPEEIGQVERAFRAEVRKVPLKDGDYTFEHTAMLYLMDAAGRFVGPLDLAAGQDLALKQIRAVL